MKKSVALMFAAVFAVQCLTAQVAEGIKLPKLARMALGLRADCFMARRNIFSLKPGRSDD